MDLNAEATAAGSSAYDLVRSLIGRIELAMSAGRLVGDEMAPIRQALSVGRNDHDRPGLPLPDPTSGGRPALPFTDLVARFALDRGMAQIQSVELAVDGAAATVDRRDRPPDLGRGSDRRSWQARPPIPTSRSRCRSSDRSSGRRHA